MKDTELARLKLHLDNAFRRYDRIDALDFELRADFTQFLCVRVSGYFEVAVKRVFAEHVRTQVPYAPINRYLAVSLKRLNTVDAGQLYTVAEAFDAEWKKSIKEYVRGGRAAAIDSVVSQRHRIAHGEDSTISHAHLVEYYRCVAEVVAYLDDHYL